MDENPWQRIPADDYEAHMRAAGQTAVLRECFSDVYAELSPARVAVLGCTTGSDLELIDPAVTETAVGVDINPAYLAVARARLDGRLGARLRLVEGDVLQVELLPTRFDLIHAALLLEYVEPAPLFARLVRWLADDGTCSVVTQEPSASAPAVSETGYRSLQTLSGHMTLRDAPAVAAAARESGLRLVSTGTRELPGGKRLVHSLFRTSR
jgi:SAM-dependent methyltransferase